MKTILMLLIFLFSFLTLPNINSQTRDAIAENKSASTDSTIEKLKVLEAKLDDKFYTRVPNKDFENIIDIKISKQVNDKFTFWFSIIGIVLTFLGGISVFAAKKYVSDEVTKRVIGEIENARAKLKSEIDNELSNLKRFQDESKKFIYSVELERIKSEQKINPRAENVTELNKLLLKSNEISDDDLVPYIIDELVRIYYYGRQVKEIDELIKNYEKYPLLSPTWVNAALCFIDEYEAYGSKQKFEQSISFLDKALSITPGYGEAQGLKLLTFVINHDKAISDDDRMKISKEILNLFNEINTSLPLCAYETMGRIRRDKSSALFSKYVDKLYTISPIQMSEMETKANQYAVENKLVKIN
ncbi:MAG: hypothetical protein HYS25_10995 [Ignavibacteriales bacterium]|nr:hypothetical protein [Ignavibacteriales bacterium]